MIAETKSGKSCFSVKKNENKSGSKHIIFLMSRDFFLSETMRLEE